MVDYIYINAVGAVVISCFTLLAAGYLFYSLARQGQGKLRVRLLLGMVISDIILGIMVLPPELSYVVGRPQVTGTRGCDALGFLFTMVLFTQHLWTLAIAIATFLLLKYPLSRSTSFMDHYSWACYPIIWGLAAIHSGLWYNYYGYVSSGNLCYYGGGSDSDHPDPRDLIQFIPRAFVFLTIIILYSKLFRFLRRPDTIQISSHYNASGETDTVSSGMSNIAGGLNHGVKRAVKHVSMRISRKSSEDQSHSHGSHNHGTSSKTGNNDDIPPWEKLEFVQVGKHRGLTISPEQTQISTFEPSIPGGILLPTSPSNHFLTSTPGEFSHNNGENYFPNPPPPQRRKGSTISILDIMANGEHAARKQETMPTPPLSRGMSLSSTFGDYKFTSRSANTTPRPSNAETLVTPVQHFSSIVDAPVENLAGSSPNLKNSTSPIVSEKQEQIHSESMISNTYKMSTDKYDMSDEKNFDGSLESGQYDHDDDDDDEDGDVGHMRSMNSAREKRENSQALTEFFQANQINNQDDTPNVKSGQQLSAAQYFNRQASLLMLYFPLAYLLVFSVSLIRLIYDMTNSGPPNPILNLVSAWFVLSVGFIDGAVYGLAEYVVRRKVRRKMPDHV